MENEIIESSNTSQLQSTDSSSSNKQLETSLETDNNNTISNLEVSHSESKVTIKEEQKSDEITSGVSSVNKDQRTQSVSIDSSNSNTSNIESPSTKRETEDRDFVFEHFLVLGVSPNNPKIKQMIKNILTSGSVSPQVTDAEILYQYPPNKLISSTKVQNFCFPENVRIGTVKRTPSASKLNELVLGQPYLFSGLSSFIFRLSGENNMVLYGICISKPELIEDFPSFLSSDDEMNLMKEKKSIYLTAQRSYCFLSKFPFFSLHFEVLKSILGQDRFFRLARYQPESGSPRSPRSTVKDATDPVPTVSNPKATITKILESYRNIDIPKVGQTIHFQLHAINKPFNFYNPLGDSESRLVTEWAVVPTLKILNIDNLITLFAAAILEKPIVIISKNLSALSCVVLSIIPLLRPFIWQGLLIPILPSSLSEVLQAPVPFITGVCNMNVMNDMKIDAIIMDLDKNNTINSNVDLPRMPEAKKLYHNIQPYHNVIYKGMQNTHASEYQTHPPISNSSSIQNGQGNSSTLGISGNASTTASTPEESKAAQAIIDCFHTYTFWLLDKIRSFYLNSNIPLNVSRNREKLNNSFVESVSSYNKEFVKSFLNTQHFSVFSDSLISNNYVVGSPKKL